MEVKATAATPMAMTTSVKLKADALRNGCQGRKGLQGFECNFKANGPGSDNVVRGESFIVWAWLVWVWAALCSG